MTEIKKDRAHRRDRGGVRTQGWEQRRKEGILKDKQFEGREDKMSLGKCNDGTQKSDREYYREDSLEGQTKKENL